MFQTKAFFRGMCFKRSDYEQDKRQPMPGADTVNPIELQAIENLVAWVAEEQHTVSDSVRGKTAERFGVSDARAVQRKDYDEVSFLLDLGLREAAP